MFASASTAFSATHGETNYRGLVDLAASARHAARQPRRHHAGACRAGRPRRRRDRRVSDHRLRRRERLHAAGVRVLMGAPNLVRGGSHSGNVATEELARAGLLDVLSSDYVPSSLLLAALRLPEAGRNARPAGRIRTVTKTPAEAVGLSDRGEIAVGKRADLIRVHRADDVPRRSAVCGAAAGASHELRYRAFVARRRLIGPAVLFWWWDRAAPARTR